MALAMFDARQAVTLAYERPECDIDGSMNDAGETLLANPREPSKLVAVYVWQGRNPVPQVHDSRAASVQVISIT